MILFLTFPTKKLLGKGFQKVLLDRLGGSSVFGLTCSSITSVAVYISFFNPELLG